MPTALKRHMVTEVPALASALATGRAAWPDERSVSRLIVRLAALGEASLKEDPAIAHGVRVARITADSGVFPFEGGLARLAEMREEWS
ncbi:MAG: hypothetical protein LBK72_10445 [Bifidobacteriaceae bacterium]|jgi:hypothetical protein|nr:hypothetical protein [Bifidobacteriaceae bacterium]